MRFDAAAGDAKNEASAWGSSDSESASDNDGGGKVPVTELKGQSSPVNGYNIDEWRADLMEGKW